MRTSAVFVVAGVAVALVPSLWMWGFTVDDALISLRYAHHLAAGAGYRFDALGPSTDGVTPLPWPFLLAPLASSADLVLVLTRVKVLGILAWAIAGGALGHALARQATAERRATILAGVALLVVGLAFPIGAWAGSGMETGLATALATIAAVSWDRPLRVAGFAGMATMLRPELVPWAVVLAAGAALAAPTTDRPRVVHRTALAVTVAMAPFLVCTAVRLMMFGRPAPLALLAKPSDLQHGAAYAFAASIVVLTPLLVFAPIALVRASSRAKTIALAAVIQALVVVAVGGDWMPYARLMVPVAPSLALVFVDLGQVAHIASSAVRAVVAIAIGVVMLVRASPAGRHVHDDRSSLIERARPALADARVVAALDIGWVGAATDATIVDLAGLTDPAIAVLPGGHTSKAVDVAMLLERGADTVLVYGEPRNVERRLLANPLFHDKFALKATLTFGPRGQLYRMYRRI